MELPPGWPLNDRNSPQFVSPSTHYFQNGASPPRATAYVTDYPIAFDEKRPIENPEFGLPQIPEAAAIPNNAFYPSHEDVLGPHITQSQSTKKSFRRKRFNFKSGIQRLYESWVDNWWLWELMAWCLSAVCMGIIALVLLLLDDTQTTTMEVTLNSIISVLSGIAKAALLLPTAEALGQLKWSWFWRDSKKVRDFETFDAASRGPWGSLMLLIRTKGKTLATIGAVITILSIAVDPFFQQLVIFPQKWVAQGTGTMPQLQTYYGSNYNITMAGSAYFSADTELRSFLEPMFFGHDLQPKIPLNCPTSNCTWEPFDTLSICSACHDVSDLLHYGCYNTTLDWLHNVTGQEKSLPVIETCGYFLNATSDNPTLMSGYIPKGDPALQEVLIARLLSMVTQTADGYKVYYDGSIHFKDIVNPIADYITVSAPNGVPSVYGNSTPVAQECVLNWCTQKFNMSYYSGNLTQIPVDPPLRTTEKTPFPWAMDAPVDGQPNYIYYANLSLTPPGQNLTFSLSNDTFFQTIVTINEFLPSLLTGRSGDPEMQYRFYNTIPPPFVRPMTVNPFSDIVNLNDRVGKLMTNVLLTSFVGANLQVGTAWEQVVFINVRWIWMVLPFTLLLFSLLFLLATIFKSEDEKGDIGIWKTSALAVLLNGLRGDVQRQMGDSHEMGEARKNAEDVRVKLMLNKKGRFRLSGINGPSWMVSPRGGPGGRTWF
ncbi:hypothetical protein NA57DRAFT_36112 [Rhizodiscina lignyota]|uniref:Uncharacterized protein n=1 Tax=Rhizodiscina lignyota TaxID=1504668 RepID=A0A9P4MCY0_9PEZI|nr:hypothetical protein NA57DRAFT_36112 [Rhizodiscina lignyota]